MKYLKKEYNRYSFEIDDDMVVKKRESGYSCNQVKYDTPVWKVTDLTTGEKLEVYEELDLVIDKMITSPNEKNSSKAQCKRIVRIIKIK